MGLWDEIKRALALVWEQLTYSKTTKTIHFTNNFQQKAKAWGLSEKDALDVYSHGEQIKENMIVRNYGGYELGIWYFTHSRTGQPHVHCQKHLIP